jgi:hypothetical protein
VLREHMARLVRTELARSSGAEKQQNFQPKEMCFFLTSTFIELIRLDQPSVHPDHIFWQMADGTKACLICAVTIRHVSGAE